ncbi:MULTISPECIES: hypothetical protein [Pseudomonas]|uniref:hypothetical protein n=1 Tax=Pseudomonas TaxID=286 RepID=UPI000F021EF5|nr:MULTISPECIES: hypothetical protein [Pseudomonas]MBD8615597.1 hypothetical protein [Pseudomonas putida]MBD8681751.1 hypothetical protein [Pseudomonas sp. CFBP 13719]
MFIDNPANTIKLAEGSEGRGPESTHYLLEMRQDTAKFYMNNIGAIPTDKNYEDAREYLTEITGLEFNCEQTESLLDLYAHVRIKLAVYDGISDTDVRDDLSYAAAHFILGCPWPTYGEQADMEEFMVMLHAQGHALGFAKVVEQA